MRLFVFLGGVLVLALLAALIAPPFINWNSFQASFERQASRIVGQPVTVRGFTTARLLPLPAVTFRDVIVGESVSGQPMMTAKKFRANIELAPLLKGEIVIVNVAMDRPLLNMRLDKEGNFDWFARQGDLPSDVAPNDVTIERLTINNGILRVYDERSDNEILLRDVDADLAAKKLTGPWNGNSVFSHLDKRYRLQGSTGTFKVEDGIKKLRTRFTLQPQDLAYDLRVTGPVEVNDKSIALSGTFQIENAGPQTGDDVIAFHRASSAGAERIGVEGAFKLTPDVLRIPSFKMNVGNRADPYVLNGTAQSKFSDGGRYSIVAEGQQINVDKLAGNAKGGEPVALSLKQRLAAVSEVLARVPQPDMTGTISLFLPAVVAGDTVIRDFGVDASPLSGQRGWQLSNLEAQLPGRTELRADGMLRLPNDIQKDDGEIAGIGFKGDLLLASRQPSGFAGWLVPEVDDAIRALPSAGFSATADISSNGADFENLEIALGDAQLKGSVSRSLAGDGGRPSLAANLSGNRVNVDTMSAFFNLFAGGAKASPSLLAGHDLDMTLDVKEAVLDGVTASNIDTAFTYVGGDLDVTRLSIASLAGAGIETRGAVQKLLSKPEGAFAGSVKVAEAAPLMALVQKRMNIPVPLRHLFRQPELLNDTDLSFDVANDAASGDAQLRFEGRTGGTDLKLEFNTNGSFTALDASKVSGTLNASNDDPLALMRQAGIEPLPVDMPPGAKVDVKIKGAVREGMKVQSSIDIAGTAASFDGQYFSPAVKGQQLTGTISLKGGDIDPILLATGVPFPGAGFGTAVDARAQLALLDNSIELKGLSGLIREKPVAGNLVLDFGAQPRTKLNGDVRISELDLDTIVQSVFGLSALIDGMGFNEEAFGGSAYRGYDAEVDLTAATADMELGLLPNATPARDLTAKLVVRDGDVRLTDMNMDWLGGRAGGAVAFSNAGTGGVFSANVFVRNGSISELGLQDEEALIEGKFDLESSLESRGANAGAFVGALSGSGKIDIRDGRLIGLNDNGLPGILQGADAREDEKLEAASGGIVRNVLLGESFDFGKTSVPFAVSNGNVRMTNIDMSAPTLSTLTDLRLDLAGRSIEGEMRGEYTTGDQAIEGVQPEFRLRLSGKFADPQASLDTTGFTTFLTSRLRERREREFEAQQAGILERQRLALDLRLTKLREIARTAKREERERLQRERIERERFVNELKRPKPEVPEPADGSAGPDAASRGPKAASSRLAKQVPAAAPRVDFTLPIQ